jgi:hypothetical protein
LEHLNLADPGSQDNLPTALTDPAQEPATVSNLQTGYCAGRVRDQVLEILGNIPRVSVFRINIQSEDPDKIQELATVFVESDTSKARQQQVAKTCKETSNRFKSSGKPVTTIFSFAYQAKGSDTTTTAPRHLRKAACWS